MKIKFLTIGLLLAVLLTAGACGAAKAQDAVPDGQPNGPIYLTEVNVTNYDDFAQNPHLQRQVDINQGNSLRVTLFANPTTGFSWDDNAQISDGAVLQQVDRQDIAASAKVAGAGGAEQWYFETLKTGKTTIHLEYSRPWPGGEKGLWTFDLTVNVR